MRDHTSSVTHITESSAPNRVSGTVRVIRIAWSVDCSVDSLVVKYRNAYQSVYSTIHSSSSAVAVAPRANMRRMAPLVPPQHANSV